MLKLAVTKNGMRCHAGMRCFLDQEFVDALKTNSVSLDNFPFIFCSLCSKSFHGVCAKLKASKLRTESASWMCHECTSHSKIDSTVKTRWMLGICKKENQFSCGKSVAGLNFETTDIETVLTSVSNQQLMNNVIKQSGKEENKLEVEIDEMKQRMNELERKLNEANRETASKVEIDEKAGNISHNLIPRVITVEEMLREFSTDKRSSSSTSSNDNDEMDVTKECSESSEIELIEDEEHDDSGINSLDLEQESVLEWKQAKSNWIDDSNDDMIESESDRSLHGIWNYAEESSLRNCDAVRDVKLLQQSWSDEHGWNMRRGTFSLNKYDLLIYFRFDESFGFDPGGLDMTCGTGLANYDDENGHGKRTVTMRIVEAYFLVLIPRPDRHDEGTSLEESIVRSSTGVWGICH